MSSSRFSTRARRAAFTLLALLTVSSAAEAQARTQPPAAAAEDQSAAITNVHYYVTFNSQLARNRTIDVAMTFDLLTPGTVLLSLPAWTPGAYELSNFARNIYDFSARPTGPGASLNELRWDKLDYDTWRIHAGATRSVTVSISYLADSLDVAAAWTAPDLAVFNGTNVFLYPEGRPSEFIARVTVLTDSTWKVVTGMKAVAGTPRTYTASSYHDLVDMPFMVGHFDVDSMRIVDRWTRLATYPSRSLAGPQRAEVWRALERMIPPQVAVFGDVPWDSYTVMQVAHPSFPSASGLEHQNSHLDIISPLAIGHPVMYGLYAHEIFHAWNVKRLRPAELVPYRYDRAQPTTQLWISEGITDYYADLSLTRGDVGEASGFYEATTSKIQSVDALPPVALEDASLSAWIHPVGGTADIYYNKGSLAGFMLDILIRNGSDNRRSLDDVMRELYATTAKDGFTTAQWWAAVNRAAGGLRTDFVERYIDGREAYPWAEVLPMAGMRLAADSILNPRLGVTTVTDSQGVVVTEILPGSSAAQAGLQVGDYLVAVGEVQVVNQNFGEQFRARYANMEGAPITIRVRRGQQALTLAGRVDIAAQVQRRVEEDPRASPKATRIRDGILRGSVDR